MVKKKTNLTHCCCCAAWFKDPLRSEFFPSLILLAYRHSHSLKRDKCQNANSREFTTTHCAHRKNGDREVCRVVAFFKQFGSHLFLLVYLYHVGRQLPVCTKFAWCPEGNCTYPILAAKFFKIQKKKRCVFYIQGNSNSTPFPPKTSKNRDWLSASNWHIGKHNVMVVYMKTCQT